MQTSITAKDGAETLQPIKILYVEDYDLVLFTVKQLLELENWQVDICRNGCAALKKIESDEHYDLLILDEQLPGESGLTLVRRVRQLTHRRHMPLIMFSGSLQHDDAMAAGVDAFLNKPTGLKNLVLICYSLLDSENVRDTGDQPKLVCNGQG